MDFVAEKDAKRNGPSPGARGWGLARGIYGFASRRSGNRHVYNSQA